MLHCLSTLIFLICGCFHPERMCRSLFSCGLRRQVAGALLCVSCKFNPVHSPTWHIYFKCHATEDLLRFWAGTFAFPIFVGTLPQDPTRGAVSPSLGATLDWLRGIARTQPQTQLRVLVTGSLYLVGDVLRLVGRVPK